MHRSDGCGVLPSNQRRSCRGAHRRGREGVRVSSAARSESINVGRANGGVAVATKPRAHVFRDNPHDVGSGRLANWLISLGVCARMQTQEHDADSDDSKRMMFDHHTIVSESLLLARCLGLWLLDDLVHGSALEVEHIQFAVVSASERGHALFCALSGKC